MRSHFSDDEVARVWDSNADAWAERVRHGDDSYREHYNNPAFLAFVGELAGKNVLDAGCGEGYNTRILASGGARMIGVDVSSRMIELAREEERRNPLGIRFERASFSDLKIFDDASFDVVVSFMALMDGPDFPGAMREIRRVLKPACPLVFSILHPLFGTRGYGWIRDQNGREIKLTVAEYFNESPWIERWKFSKSPNAAEQANFTVPRFDRTLSFYVNSIIGAGLELREIHEPRPTEEACRQHPWLSRFRVHAPLFIYFRAVRPD